MAFIFTFIQRRRRRRKRNMKREKEKHEEREREREEEISCGGWRACTFLLWFEMIERLTFFGILSNLITYFTTELGEGTAESARNVNIWTGVNPVASILAAFVADAFLGQYCAIALMSIVYILGLIFLFLSVTLFKPAECDRSIISNCPEATTLQVSSFFISIYFISLGTGSVKPCLEAFGADQFNDTNPAQKKMKSSFFNWWYFSYSTGCLLAYSMVVYIQYTLGWGASFGFITVCFGITLILFLVGTPFYRRNAPSGSPFTSIAQVLVVVVHKWNTKFPDDNTLLYEKYEKESLSRRQLLCTKDLRFLDKAATIFSSKQSRHDITSEELNVFLIIDEEEISGINASPWKLCSITQVEEVKLILRIIPIWISSVMYGIVIAQTSSLFTKQGNTVDCRITSSFSIPAPALNSFTSIFGLILLPLYDRVFVPCARWLTGNERGITLLQRMGVGFFMAIMVMVVAALTEMKRLKIVLENGLIDQPDVTIPMSIFWFLPQYLIVGVSDVFMVAGLQEFFYDQMPNSMKSIGMALFSCTYGMGGLVSSFLITVVDAITGEYGGQSWFVNNLNRCHLDYFYCLLAVLSTLTFCIYIMIACSFTYKRIG